MKFYTSVFVVGGQPIYLGQPSIYCIVRIAEMNVVHGLNKHRTYTTVHESVGMCFGAP